MTADPLSFFTVDHGTATTAAALIAPFCGRFRLLAAGAAPRGIPAELLLEDLVHRVQAVEPDALPGAHEWASWARLEVATHEPPLIVCAAGSQPRLHELVTVFSAAGWDVVGAFAGARVDPIAVTRAASDRHVSAVALAAADPPGAEERPHGAELAAVLGAVVRRQPALHAIVCGGAAAWSEHFPRERVVRAPATRSAADGPSGRTSALHDAALALATRFGAQPDRPLPDGRRAFPVGVASLASLLDRPVDAIDIGHSAGSHATATTDGPGLHVVDAGAALVPRHAMDDDAEVDAILRWCALRGDPFTLRDGIRDLRLAPWREVSGDGMRLRLAALRAALIRLASSRAGAGHAFALRRRSVATARVGRDGRRPSPSATGGVEGAGAERPDPPAELLVLGGGAVAAVPPPVAALAGLDALRRPGVFTMLCDHARLLAPIGTLAETDRRRLLADLVDDAFLPLAGAIVAGDVRNARHPATVRVTSPVGTARATVAPGMLQSLDLPPGVTARVDLEGREPLWVGARGRHVTFEMTGGLGGLLLDARESPLRLPDRAERRRAVLDGWERPLWAAEA